jgi:RimJ/RimL family protein N-acetyltransferase
VFGVLFLQPIFDMLTEENFFDCSCPHCGGTNSLPGESAGRIQECARCGQDFVTSADKSATGLKIPLPLTLSAVTLRAVEERDLNDLLPLMPPWNVREELAFGRVNEMAVLRWIEAENHLKFTSPNRKVCLVVESVEAKKVVGVVTLDYIDGFWQQAAIHIEVNPDFQRKGYATEALSALLHLCFDVFHFHRISATCEGDNIAAWRLLETVGMRREGELVKTEQVEGRWVNTLLYAVLHEEYRFEDEMS